MLRDRLIFGLIYNNGAFMQSRNFRLQRVGDINWLEKNYKFQKISFSIDELVVVDASRNDKNIEVFASTVRRLVEKVFVPVAAGGGIKKVSDAETLFLNGADKVVINSALYRDPDLVKQIIDRYGSQSLVASVDYKMSEGECCVYIDDGSTLIEASLLEYLSYVESLGVGEILLNSIDKDGTGFGYDLDIVSQYCSGLNVPLILMGGAGKESHLLDGMKLPEVSAVATANLFNFIGNGLPNAREFMLSSGANLANWNPGCR
ncbi:imidazole glycerol phosphate synthase cyclase subunit [Gammaproteobacteria bacterium 45_16_T64]|nr:imidazole glycerol phosphate synthase cyclase subunit [Gammaproteobacteria bacterium 45_16_T64]